MIPTPKQRTSVIEVTETEAPDLARDSPILVSKSRKALQSKNILNCN